MSIKKDETSIHDINTMNVIGSLYSMDYFRKKLYLFLCSVDILLLYLYKKRRNGLSKLK